MEKKIKNMIDKVSKEFILNVLNLYNEELTAIYTYESTPDDCKVCKWYDVCNFAGIECCETCALCYAIDKTLKDFIAKYPAGINAKEI